MFNYEQLLGMLVRVVSLIDGEHDRATMIESDPQTGRAARRRGRARAQLISAAAEIIASKGSEGLRLREITDRADVAVGAFYHHFDSKDALVTAVVHQTIESLASSTIAQALELEDAAESAAVAHRWFVDLATREPQLARVIVKLDVAEDFLGDTFRNRGRELLERGIASGRFRELDVDATLTFTVGATLGMLRAILDGRLPPSAVIASTEAFLCTLGISPAEAAMIARRAVTLPSTTPP